MFTELLMNIAHEMLVNTRISSLYLVNSTELNGPVTYREHDYRSTFYSSSFYSAGCSIEMAVTATQPY